MISISIFRNICWHRTAICTIVLASAISLKQYFSHATADQLRWILAPTTALVEIFSGWEFEFESYAGYLNKEHLFLITSSCSGMNFFIAAYLMLSLMGVMRSQSRKSQWGSIVSGAVIAYAATIVTNSVRISFAMRLQEAKVSAGWLDVARVHRFEGIVVYFGSLFLLFIACRGDRKVALLRSTWMPAAIYYGIAVGIPLANGAFKEGMIFWEHTMFVLIVPIVIILSAETLRSKLKS